MAKETNPVKKVKNPAEFTTCKKCGTTRKLPDPCKCKRPLIKNS